MKRTADFWKALELGREMAFLLFLLAALLPGQSDRYRPEYHFAPQQHWTNDPNGLVFLEGEYHLFFQYNPFGDKWGHMSWGHAVSRDLAHWTQLPVALPEENGVMIFTGSTVLDAHNTSGFCENSKPCLVAIYTGHTPPSNGTRALQTQNVAYSNDRGRTWTKFEGNPVLDLHMSEFRDPKVLWSGASRQWIMAVSLPDDHKVRLYGSPNLKNWTQLSEFGPAGATGGQWECPELFQLPVTGGHETRWVLKVGLNPGGLQGGSGEQYFVGKFDGKQFRNDNPVAQTMWTDYGKDCYCALTFNNLPKSKPMVMIGWMDNWQYAADLPTAPFRGQMTVPRKLALHQTTDGLRLVQQPIDAVESLRTEGHAASSSDLNTLNKTLAKNPLPESHTFQIEATFDLGSAATGGLRLVSADGNATVIGFERQNGTLFLDRTKSGNVSFNKDFPARVEAPLKLTGSSLQLTILGDRDSLEVFADGGLVTMTNLIFPPAGTQVVDVYALGGTLGNVSVKSWALKAPKPSS